MDSKEILGGSIIRVLPPHVARKIAAGEVIERPQSVVRELLDNSIDAAASEISVWLKSGGIDEIIFQDDGRGMSKEDLLLCCLPHATSKIETEDDLLHIRSLGFRGEALAAISSVSRIEIQSSYKGNSALIEIHGGEQQRIGLSSLPRGTRIAVASLFYNLPARRHFMKRSSSEYSLCATALIEKALAHPQISFKLYHDNELRYNFLACTGDSALKERLWQVYSKELMEKKFLHHLHAHTKGTTIDLLCMEHSIYRHDKKLMQVFINGRRIIDYGLIQAIEYGYSSNIPGGRYPLAFIFLDIDPALLDVNIHPAKREVKLHNHGEIHHALVNAIQSFLRSSALQNFSPRQIEKTETKQLFDLAIRSHSISSNQNQNPIPVQNSRINFQQERNYNISEPVLKHDVVSENRALDFMYLGQIFGCFLVFTHNEELVCMDMHAAHERIVYNDLLTKTTSQTLLVPIDLELSRKASIWLLRELDAITQCGFVFEAHKDDRWSIHACPAWLVSDIDSVIDFLQDPFGEAAELLRRSGAQIACRKAIKDGDKIDTSSAQELIQKALNLPEPRCPHGRPIWYTLGKEDLFTLIGRHV